MQNKSRNILQLAGRLSSMFYTHITLGFPTSMQSKSCECCGCPYGEKTSHLLLFLRLKEYFLQVLLERATQEQTLSL